MTLQEKAALQAQVALALAQAVASGDSNFQGAEVQKAWEWSDVFMGQYRQRYPNVIPPFEASADKQPD
jgi:hypothetical protein